MLRSPVVHGRSRAAGSPVRRMRRRRHLADRQVGLGLFVENKHDPCDRIVLAHHGMVLPSSGSAGPTFGHETGAGSDIDDDAGGGYACRSHCRVPDAFAEKRTSHLVPLVGNTLEVFADLVAHDALKS
jgi:hypothetical protein